MIRLLILFLLSLLSPLAHAALEASVERTRLVEGESLELTLETRGPGHLEEILASLCKQGAQVETLK